MRFNQAKFPAQSRVWSRDPSQLQAVVLVLSHTQASKEAYDLDGTQDPRERNGYPLQYSLSFPGGLDGKESACNPGDLGSISGLGRSPGERNGNPFQYSCLENSMERGSWQATVHRVTYSQT